MWSFYGWVLWNALSHMIFHEPAEALSAYTFFKCTYFQDSTHTTHTFCCVSEFILRNRPDNKSVMHCNILPFIEMKPSVITKHSVEHVLNQSLSLHWRFCSLQSCTIYRFTHSKATNCQLLKKTRKANTPMTHIRDIKTPISTSVL